MLKFITVDGEWDVNWVEHAKRRSDVELPLHPRLATRTVRANLAELPSGACKGPVATAAR